MFCWRMRRSVQLSNTIPCSLKGTDWILIRQSLLLNAKTKPLYKVQAWRKELRFFCFSCPALENPKEWKTCRKAKWNHLRACPHKPASLRLQPVFSPSRTKTFQPLQSKPAVSDGFGHNKSELVKPVFPHVKERVTLQLWPHPHGSACFHVCAAATRRHWGHATQRGKNAALLGLINHYSNSQYIHKKASCQILLSQQQLASTVNLSEANKETGKHGPFLGHLAGLCFTSM